MQLHYPRRLRRPRTPLKRVWTLLEQHSPKKHVRKEGSIDHGADRAPASVQSTAIATADLQLLPFAWAFSLASLEVLHRAWAMHGASSRMTKRFIATIIEFALSPIYSFAQASDESSSEYYRKATPKTMGHASPSAWDYGKHCVKEPTQERQDAQRRA